MKLSILSKTDKRISFLVEGIDTELANALRRMFLTEVPTMAITEVLFIENSSPLYDETIAHRLGLVPLTTDLDSYVLSERCTCEGAGCAKCQVDFQLSVNAKDGNRNVYSSDLVPSDPKIKPVSDKILITKLAKGNKLLFEAYARLGIGKDHAKWQATTKATYKMYPEITIDQDAFANYPYKGDNENDPLIKVCPKKILQWEGDQLVVTDLERCTMDQACTKNVPDVPAGAITIKPVKGKFIFFVESTGALPPERIVEEGIKLMQEKVTRFGSLASDLIAKQST
jgi:DNA-directed RNA polymerase subunit D